MTCSRRFFIPPVDSTVAKRARPMAAEAVRGGEAARGEDEERRHLFGGSKFILGLDGQNFNDF